MKALIKFFLTVLISIIFLGFMVIVLLNSVFSNTIANQRFYQGVIFATDTPLEVREVVLKTVAKDIVANYEGDLDEEVVHHIIKQSLRATFQINWFQNTLRIYADDWVSFLNGNTAGFTAAIRIDEERLRYRSNLSINIHENIPGLVHEEILFYTNELEAVSDLPNPILFNELLSEYIASETMSIIDGIPTFRDILVLAIYLGFGVFMVAYFALGGLIRIFRWMAGMATIATASFISGLFVFGRGIIVDELVFLNFSAATIDQIIDEIFLNSILELTIILVISLVIFIIGLLIGRKKFQNKLKEQQKKIEDQKKLEQELAELENLDIVEVAVEKKDDDYDPFAEKPIINKEKPPEPPVRPSAENFYKEVENYKKNEEKDAENSE